MNNQSNLSLCAGSFRDTSGQVYFIDGKIIRTIETIYSKHFEHGVQSGFFKQAIDKGLLLEFTEIDPINNAWKSITAPLLPFISYHYEWSFGQLKDAALLTLDMLDLALEHDMVLKDATAYNIQFIGSKPIFIDHLSFEIRDPAAPWVAYLQFCRHFLAPLALMAKRSVICSRMLFSWIEGLPLDLTASLLPFLTRFSPSLGIHIHMHATKI